MKQFLAAFGAVCVYLIPLVGSAQPSTSLLVPGGTAIPVHVIGTISSSSMKEGDTFHVQAAQDVVIGGMIVVRSGALASGTMR